MSLYCRKKRQLSRARFITDNISKSYLADGLITLEIINNGGQETLDRGQLSTLGRNLKVNLGNLDSGGIGLDELTVEIGLAGDLAVVNGASNSDSVGLLELIRAVSAVRAVESHQDHLTEVRHTGQQQASSTLYTRSICKRVSILGNKSLRDTSGPGDLGNNRVAALNPSLWC